MHAAARTALVVADVIMTPFVVAAGLVFRAVRRIGVGRLPASRAVLRHLGVQPVSDHYYDPYVDPRALRRPLDQERRLPGITWDEAAQLELLERFTFGGELADVPESSDDPLVFRRGNPAFGGGDADVLYQLIRLLKPARIIEIGSGHSTLIAARAVRRTLQEDPARRCEHLCVEPYEMPWLERAGVTVIRRRVEDVGLDLFASLASNDLLFIDSTHVIRPQGDVLFEYLELLPSLKPGVVVHVHDIFTPRDYKRAWVVDQMRLWNEQYLLEAFLSCNRQWRVLAAVNHLHHRHPARLAAVCPLLRPGDEPGSFYLQRVE